MKSMIVVLDDDREVVVNYKGDCRHCIKILNVTDSSGSEVIELNKHEHAEVLCKVYDEEEGL